MVGVWPNFLFYRGVHTNFDLLERVWAIFFFLAGEGQVKYIGGQDNFFGKREYFLFNF